MPEEVSCCEEAVPVQGADGKYRFCFAVNANTPGVSEHFPQKHLVAAYMQVQWLEECLAKLSPSRRIREIPDAKFRAMILVPEQVEVVFEVKEELARFEIHDSEGLKTSGRLALRSIEDVC